MPFDPTKPSELISQGGFDPSKPSERVNVPTVSPERLGAIGGINAATGGLAEAVPSIVRYGGPIVAGLATLEAGPFVMGAAGSAVSAASESAAQSLEKFMGMRPEMEPRKIAASGVLGAATPIKVSNGIVNFLANTGSNVALNEVARGVEKGKVEAPKLELEDVVTRFGMPVAFGTLNSFLSGRNKSFQAAKEARDAITAERQGGSVMLSDIFPNLTDLEKSAVKNGNPKAVDALQNMDSNIGNVLADAYKDAPDSSKIASMLSPHVGQLEKLQQDAKAARDLALKAEQQANEAVAGARADAIELKDAAKKAAMDASVKAYTYNQGIERLFGGSSQKIGTILSGASNERLQGVAKSAKDSIESGLDRIYSDVGIGLNDPVVSVQDIVNSATKMSEKGLPLEGNITRDEFIKTLGKSLDTIDPMSSGNISLEGYRKFRDIFARNLAEITGDANYANRVASGSYNVVKDAANEYVSRNLPGVADKFRFANAAAADLYRTKASNVIDLISNGETDKLVNLFKEAKTSKPILDEIDSYAAAIEGMGGREAKAAANGFKRDVMATVRDGLVADSLHTGTGQDLSGKIIDFPKLITSLDGLRQRQFPVELLGLGDAKEIRQLARVASAGGAGGMTVDQFQKFIQNRNNLGAGAALARQEWFNAYRDSLIGGDIKNQANKAARLNRLAKDAKFNADSLQQAMDDAAKDPIISLLSDTSMKLSKDPAKNSNWVGSLMSLSPDTAGRFVDALKSSGRTAILDDLKKATSAEIFNSMFQKIEDASNKRLKLSSVTDFFYGPGNENRRAVLKKFIGDAEYQNIENKFVKPIQGIIKQQETISPSGNLGADPIRAFAALKGRLEGKSTGGLIEATGIKAIYNYLKDSRYNTLHLLYVNPKTADAFAKTGYNIDKFVASNAANATALRMAMSDDAENASNR